MDTGAPLVGEGLPVDEDQSRYTVRSNQGTGDDSFAGTGRSDQHAEIVHSQCIEGLSLFGIKCGREIECVGIPLTAFVDEIQTAAGLLDEIA